MRGHNVEQKYRTIETVPKYNRKCIPIEAKYILLSHIYMSDQFFWLRRGSSTKSGGTKN